MLPKPVREASRPPLDAHPYRLRPASRRAPAWICCAAPVSRRAVRRARGHRSSGAARRRARAAPGPRHEALRPRARSSRTSAARSPGERSRRRRQPRPCARGAWLARAATKRPPPGRWASSSASLPPRPHRWWPAGLLGRARTPHGRLSGIVGASRRLCHAWPLPRLPSDGPDDGAAGNRHDRADAAPPCALIHRSRRLRGGHRPGIRLDRCHCQQASTGATLNGTSTVAPGDTRRRQLLSPQPAPHGAAQPRARRRLPACRRCTQPRRSRRLSRGHLRSRVAPGGTARDG